MNRLMTIAMLAVVGLAPAMPAVAHGWNNDPAPTPAPSVSSESSSQRTYHYRVGYRNGGSGYGFRTNGNSRDYDTGYSGSSIGQISSPHRNNWNTYLKRIATQRKAAMQDSANGTRCGFINSPLECFTVSRLYPTEAPRTPPSWNNN
jgi:hypothetical protein